MSENKPVEPLSNVECPARDFLLKSKVKSFEGATMDAFVTDSLGRRFKVPYVEPKGKCEKLRYEGLQLDKAVLLDVKDVDIEEFQI